MSSLTPKEQGEIAWLVKSGYSVEAIKRKTKLPKLEIKRIYNTVKPTLKKNE